MENLIKNFCKKHNLSYNTIEKGLKSDIILVDRMGELINIYSVADIVILGGSFVDNVGGHNPLEVAYFNKPLISGKYIFNQKALFEMVGDYYLIDKSNLNISKASFSIAPPAYSYHSISDFDVGKVGWGWKNFTASFAQTTEFSKIRHLNYVGIRYRLYNQYGVRFEPWHIKVI